MFLCSLSSGPFKNYPQITVYHPDSNNGYPFINIGWSGWVGSITGKDTIFFCWYSGFIVHVRVGIIIDRDFFSDDLHI